MLWFKICPVLSHCSPPPPRQSRLTNWFPGFIFVLQSTLVHSSQSNYFLLQKVARPYNLCFQNPPLVSHLTLSLPWPSRPYMIFLQSIFLTFTPFCFPSWQNVLQPHCALCFPLMLQDASCFKHFAPSALLLGKLFVQKFLTWLTPYFKSLFKCYFIQESFH